MPSERQAGEHLRERGAAAREQVAGEDGTPRSPRRRRVPSGPTAAMPADAPFAGSQDPAVVRLAIPSKGNMEEPTLAFLGACGLRVQRDNPRQYSARVAGQPTVRAVFQRPSDIPPKLADGIVDIGITGYDVYREHVGDTNDVIVAMDDLGFARCELVLAVPEAWVDVSSIRDLVELAADFRAEGRRLRIATGYPRLVRDFLLRTDISNFSLVESAGALEISPVLGYADLIADINQTGTTLRANHLKPLAGGTILRSQACLLIHRQGFRASAAKRSILRAILELIEAQQRARQYYSVVANMRGRSVQEVAAAINSRPELAGIQGPTLSEVIAHRETEYHWYAVTLVVTTARLINVIDHLRAIGGSGITVTEARYVFEDICQTYARLAPSLGDDTSSSPPAAP